MYHTDICTQIRQELDKETTRSAWSRGVKAYAVELLEDLDNAINDGYCDPANIADQESLRAQLLNGAGSWHNYSWGGCSLIYNCDIARRLCTPSQLRKTRDGERGPNAREEWLDTQARALAQAAGMIRTAAQMIGASIPTAPKIQPGEIYAEAVKLLPAEDIDHHGSDLYIKKTAASDALVDRLTTKSLLSRFVSPIDCAVWYDLPFCFSPYWDSKEARH